MEQDMSVCCLPDQYSYLSILSSDMYPVGGLLRNNDAQYFHNIKT